MRRNVSMEEISDGKLYGLNDMVKADCFDCKGCSDCCRGMGKSILLTPYDIYQLTVKGKISFEELLNSGKIELGVADGVILPNLKMQEDSQACSFLNEEGRCTIHEYRPGICRLFPLGRYYDEKGIRYFLQIYECSNKNRGKVKVYRWIDQPDIKQNEAFIQRWHDLVRNFSDFLRENPDEQTARALNMRLLKTFFLTPYTDEDFYEQAEKRFRELT